jgi:acetolactate synthase-1/2/3 large subunit
LADAKMDSVPLVAITGQVPRSVIGTDAFPGSSDRRSLPAITSIITWFSTPGNVRIVKEAFHLAVPAGPGPVLDRHPQGRSEHPVPDPNYGVA